MYRLTIRRLPPSQRVQALLLLLWLLSVAPVLRANPPTPEEFFGHRMGADRALVQWQKVVDYFHRLDAASDRILVRELGKSTEGRPFIAAFLGSPLTEAELERIRSIQARLADPRGLSQDAARELTRQGKTVVLITCSIHSTEVASTLTAAEFAWDFAADTGNRWGPVRDNVLILLVPSLNPDGVDIVADWYEKTLGTPYEGSSPPQLYHKYTGHDNNRDWYIFSQVETRLTIEHLHNVWHPQIVYDVHQMGATAARLFVPPWIDPIDPNVDPLLVQSMNATGMQMALDVTAAGLPGVVVNGIYDFWTPSRHYQAYHAGLRILTESASAKLATPVTIDPKRLNHDGRGYNPAQASWNHPDPWPGGKWTLRDIVDYQLVAWESLVRQAALRKSEYLWNFYRIGERATARTSPFAWVIPATQRDPGATRKLLETLLFGQVEVERAQAAFEADGIRYPAGSYVIPMAQPYSSWAKTLLEVQNYPDLRQYPGGPPRRPYDVTAHTLPLLFGVDAAPVRKTFQAQAERIVAPVPPVHRTRLPMADTDSWKRVAAAWKQNEPVYLNWRESTFYLQSTPGAGRVPKPRIGIYQSWVPSMDEGWTRWILDAFGLEYQTLHNADILAGALAEGFDAIVLPDSSAAAIREGHGAAEMPAEFTGGLGADGFLRLDEFVRAGGTAIYLNRAGLYPESLNVRNALKDVSPNTYYCPGSLVWATLRQSHPLTMGLPSKVALWVDNQSPAWELAEPRWQQSIAKYEDRDPLASGWLLGGNHLTGKSPLVEVTRGKGRHILFGFRPQYRGQSYLTVKLLLNAFLRHLL